MGGKIQNKFLTVAPFECAWHEELRFSEAGRGCIAFEAFAHNDVTLVFREQVGSQHYHYKMDNSPNYTVILGSHRNRRLKIEVDGHTVVDIAGIVLCSSSAFQSYWISIYDGLISVGKGRNPFQDLVFQWRDSKPNCRIQYVGLSSWDKHVGYRNVNVLPLTQHQNFLGFHIDHKEDDRDDNEDADSIERHDGHDEWGLGNFLESWELSDIFFIVGDEGQVVPAHRIILSASGHFNYGPGECFIRLPSVSYPALHAFLEYIYTGRTHIIESDLFSLRDLSVRFQVTALVKHCEETIDRFKTNKKLFDSGKKVELTNFLQGFFLNGDYSDVDIFIDGHGLVARGHKLILSIWSAPFTKMFTNGMLESKASRISLSDVSVDAFLALLRFMYGGKLEMEDETRIGALLVPLLLLADQFGIKRLHQECCNYFLEQLSEDSVCSILLAISAIPSCGLLEEECVKKFSKHFDYCTTASAEFATLEEETFRNILQHPDLTVTSEERVLDAVLMWCMQADDIFGWETVDELLKSSETHLFFKDGLPMLESLLHLVRFPLLPSTTLEKLERSFICSKFLALDLLVKEALEYRELGVRPSGADQNVRFQHRRSSFKELQYICDGDSNGVIYYAGTSYGEHQWVNPVLAKRISLTASSPISRYTDPKVLVSRTYQATSFAGPRIENGRSCAWWIIDIGQEHQLMCNYYTLRQDGSAAFLRDWALQGSLDMETWTNLRVHENDQTICKRGQFSSWAIHGPSALLPFRFFRIIMTGPAADASNPWNLCICFVELYGYFC
ncbi:unnamed protein product [Spirodela intermedia]|uniref:BTB domain-containing protein n=1 Tax=Spirodela intermedia TaxID=51605 RepID=A0A7I8IK08_SPIIN|nr:unnamed protein product [Spirodela intermedia]CAA6657824.1 unnamed protein product [Spirodela intermedia]